MLLCPGRALVLLPPLPAPLLMAQTWKVHCHPGHCLIPPGPSSLLVMGLQGGGQWRMNDPVLASSLRTTSTGFAQSAGPVGKEMNSEDTEEVAPEWW